MTNNVLLITTLRLLLAFSFAWLGTLIGFLAPFKVPVTRPLTLFDPLLPVAILFMGMGSTILPAVVIICAVLTFLVFVIFQELPWTCAPIIAAFAGVGHTVKRSWSS